MSRPTISNSGKQRRTSVWLTPSHLELLRQLADRLECSQREVVERGLELVLGEIGGGT